jgi:hypothetical protein
MEYTLTFMKKKENPEDHNYVREEPVVSYI